MAEKLNMYRDMLIDWQGRMNLVARSTLDQAWERHFEDSLQLLPLIPQRTKTLFDFGSGAGFPGLVIGIMRPDIQVCLFESTGKKCSFLEAVAQETGAENVRIFNQNIDKNKDLKGLVPDVITARALASLDKLLTYTRPFSRQISDLTLIFPKGQRADEEIKTARTRWRFDVEKVQSQTDKEASILVIKNLKPCA